MVLPVTESGMRQQERKLGRINERARSSLAEDGIKELAKLEAKKAVERIKCVSHKSFRTVRLDTAESRLSESSLLSAEQKGSLRAMVEDIDTRERLTSDFSRREMAPISEEVTTVETNGRKTKRKKRKLRLFFKKKSKSENGPVDSTERRRTDLGAKQFSRKGTLSSIFVDQSPFSRTKDISRDAWMCGVCGKMFSSYKVAESHENNCMLDVVSKVNGAVPGNNSNPVEPAEFESSVNDTFEGDEENGFSNDSDTDQLLLDLDLQDHPSASTAEQDLTANSHLASPLSEEKRAEIKARIEDVAKQFPIVALDNEGGDDEEMLTPRIGRRPETTLDRLKLSSANFSEEGSDDILMTNHLRQNVSITDEAVASVVKRAVPFVLTTAELEAERDLEYIVRDKQYYDGLTERASVLKTNPLAKFRTDGKNFLSKVQNKFVDAYQLIKEGDAEDDKVDIYNKKDREGATSSGMQMNNRTHYVNVIVRHSIRVVNNELERLAKKRWEENRAIKNDRFEKFERFRAFAQGNLVKLATLALASDFTPRKVAVQLSNDLYRLIGPQLKRRGVRIQTEIEYRVGPYFILAVNVERIDWIKLIKFTHKSEMKRRRAWEDGQDRREELNDCTTSNGLSACLEQIAQFAMNLRSITGIEIIAYLLGCLYYVHWSIAVPLCILAYRVVIPSRMTKYILSTVTDDIISYVESKGMEMEVRIAEPQAQAAFMLSALREIRDDNRAAKKKQKETESEDKGDLVGPLLGPAIAADKGPAPEPPAGFVDPEHLEFVSLEVDLPVGFKRFRWALLSPESKFVTDAVFVATNYENFERKEWSKYHEHIGAAKLPDGVTDDDIVGAEYDASYLFPKTAFVKANMSYENTQITVYNDNCFVIKKRTRNPEVPYGSTFWAWTQYVVTNTGNNTCRMVCSVEAEFPNGQPIIARQIQSGMRSGTSILFVQMGEMACKYANEYP